MERFKFKLGAFTLFFILVINASTINGVSTTVGVDTNADRFEGNVDNDFYFVQLTDTHVMHRLFDWKEVSKNRLRSVLDHVSSFEKKPAFIVITGDLTNWGGGILSGALNCLAFTSCFYKKDGQLYADAAYAIPVYTTPGNHEYIYTRNLKNYHRYIENENRYIVNYSDMSLFFLNSGPFCSSYPSGGDGLYDCDMEWFEDALENCTSPLKIVLMHHPAVYFRNDEGRMRDVIVQNREAFVNACENHSVELVLTGHTHESRVFDGDENSYDENTSFNCSEYPTLFVQTTDCDQGVHYRNVSIIGNNVWLEPCVEVTISDPSFFHLPFLQDTDALFPFS